MFWLIYVMFGQKLNKKENETPIVGHTCCENDLWIFFFLFSAHFPQISDSLENWRTLSVTYRNERRKKLKKKSTYVTNQYWKWCIIFFPYNCDRVLISLVLFFLPTNEIFEWKHMTNVQVLRRCIVQSDDDDDNQ